jgi:ABC-type sugar transport system permease subunit
VRAGRSARPHKRCRHWRKAAWHTPEFPTRSVIGLISNPQKATKPARKRLSQVNYSRYGYYFILPFFVFYAFFQLYPLINTFYLAFQKYMKTAAGKVVGPTFIGFENFTSLLTKGATLQVFENTAIMWGINFVPQMLLALLLAKWFTDTRMHIRGQGAIKVMVYMPNIITAASISVLFFSLFAHPQGPVNHLMAELGLINKEIYMQPGQAATVAINFLNDGWKTRLIVAFINFWMWYGHTMIVLIAGILGIPTSLYEAAQVDGASPNQIFRLITLPLIKPIMLYTLVTSLIGGMQMYDVPAMIIRQGSPAKAKVQSVTMYILEMAFTGTKDYGRAAAVSVFLFLVTAVASIALFVMMRDKDAAKERKMDRAAKRDAKGVRA